MLGEIDKDLKPYKPKIFLAKPNRQIIAKLNEAYNIVMTFHFNGIHELTFNIPYTIQRNHITVHNNHVDLIRGHFLLKVDNDWYVINKPNKTTQDGKEILQVSAYRLPYELRNKTIRLYQDTKKASDVLSDALKNTTWKVGYVDADFDLKYRTFDVTEKTVLDFLNDIETTFDGVLVYDTEKKEVNFYKEENVGTDKGLYIRYGKYLKSINEEPNFDEVCTRLYAYGKDNLTFNDVNLTGTNYIEDFSYYMYPYEEEIIDEVNDEYTVISHSNYMSDELCHAILKYNKLLENKKPTFEDLLNQLNTLQEELQTLQDQYDSLNNDMMIILDNIDVYQATHNNSTPIDLINQRDSKQNELDNKQSEINAKEVQIADVQMQINQLKEEISIENNFSQELIIERDSYIFEKKFEDTNFTDSKELLERAKTEIKKLSQPQISYTIDIIDFLKVVECQKDWDKLNIGDIITIKYPNFNINIKAKLITITHDFDNNKITLEIANSKDIKNGFLMLQDLIKNNISTSTVVDVSKFRWDMAEEANSKVVQLINSKIDANKNMVLAGTNENYTLDRRGLTFKDPNDPMNFLRILHNIVAFTNDGGNTYKHAITPTGIVGEYIYGKIITGINLIIGDKDGILEILGNKMVITDDQDNIVMKMGLYKNMEEDGVDKYGIELLNNRNIVIMDKDDGFKIQRNTGTEWDDIAWLDTNGVLNLESIIAKRIQIINGNGEEMINTDTSEMNIGKFINIITDGKLTALEKLQVRAEWIRIQGEKERLVIQGQSYATIDRDNETHINLNPYLTAYNNLEAYITPLLSNMDETSTINRDTFNSVFTAYYNEAINLINTITNVLRYSSLQLGRYYNNVVIDSINGLIATRSDGNVRTILNATDGIKIQRKESGVWVDKFYADTYGILYVEDVVTKRQKIEDGLDNLLIDAENGILDLSKFKVIIGSLSAENIETKVIYADEGFITDLTVNHLRTTDDNPDLDVINYIDIQGRYARWITGTKTGSPQQATNSKGQLLYYTDSSMTDVTTTVTPYPVNVYSYTKETKLQIYFKSNDSFEVPVIEMGAGNGTGDEAKGFIHKEQTALQVEYVAEGGRGTNGIKIHNDGLSMYVPNGLFDISTTRFKLSTTTSTIEADGTGSLKLSHNSGSYIEFQNNGNIVIHSAGNIYLN